MKNLPWLVLRAANRAQARGSTVRLIVLRTPEVAEELGMDLTDTRLLSVEEYLQERGYIESANILSTWGTYTITPAGLRWLEEAPSEPPEQPTEASENVVEEPGEPHQNLSRSLSRRPEGEEARLDAASPQEATERVSWWQRRFGG
jgi:DNA-binding PadR family transcriptional regulator